MADGDPENEQTTTGESTRGVIQDYFGLASDSIVPLSSNNGDGRNRFCAVNATTVGNTQSGAGRYSSDGDYTSGIWRNPTVTYRIVGDTTVSLQLGKAFASTMSEGVMVISGYMIVSAEIDTSIGEFPLLTVSAVANEGADAINLFNVSVAVEGSAHAQNLMGAMSGSCVLQASKLAAKCDPVVCAENGMPCASDVVKGVLTFDGDVIARLSTDNIVAANGFVEVNGAREDRESAFSSFSFRARKEMV